MGEKLIVRTEMKNLASDSWTIGERRTAGGDIVHVITEPGDWSDSCSVVWIMACERRMQLVYGSHSLQAAF